LGDTAQLPACAFIAHLLAYFSVICKANHTVSLHKFRLNAFIRFAENATYSIPALNLHNLTAQLRDNNYAVQPLAFYSYRKVIL